MQLTTRSLVKGIVTRLPGLARFANRSTGGTVSARYCYSVWMRHLVVVTNKLGLIRPRCVAELGPGDSLGIGLCAMLCGADRYYALDRLEFANSHANLLIFEELTELLTTRSPIPDDSEFPGVYPKLDAYQFPAAILDDQWLAHCLDPKRLNEIRMTLEGTRKCDKIEMRYFAPWDDDAAIQPESVDWIFSQAVLEHVDDVRGTYVNLTKWLRPGGLMSHRIDYTCHGLTRDWNGHWTISDSMWRVVRGRRAYLINRLPHSVHAQALRACGLRIVAEIRTNGPSLQRTALANSFRYLKDDDLSTSGAFLIATKE